MPLGFFLVRVRHVEQFCLREMRAADLHAHRQVAHETAGDRQRRHAREVGADVLVIATDVANVMVDFGTPDQRPLGRVTVAEMNEHAAAGQFARGSMGPKVQAALRFVESGGRRAVITSLEHIADAVQRDDVGTVLTA